LELDLTFQRNSRLPGSCADARATKGTAPASNVHTHVMQQSAAFMSLRCLIGRTVSTPNPGPVLPTSH
jgi:hypothetical protein